MDRVRVPIVALSLLLAAPMFAQQQTDTHNIDIAQKRITETNYHNSEMVELAGPQAGGWHLQAGTAIHAQRIDLSLRNVRGTIRFRADSSRLDGLKNRATIRRINIER